MSMKSIRLGVVDRSLLFQLVGFNELVSLIILINIIDLQSIIIVQMYNTIKQYFGYIDVSKLNGL